MNELVRLGVEGVTTENLAIVELLGAGRAPGLGFTSNCPNGA